MKDKFKMNFFIALPAAIVAMILYSVVGGTGSGAIKAGSYNIIEVLPYLIVLGAALMGINVVSCTFCRNPLCRYYRTLCGKLRIL